MEPKLNEIRRGRDIGSKYPSGKYYAYVACPQCGQPRWSACRKGDLYGADKKLCPVCRNTANGKKRRGKYHSPNRLDLVGKRFGRLLVLEDAGTRKRGTDHAESTWLCLCDCGNKKVITGTNLRTGDATSCGCYNIERTIERNTIDPVDLKLNLITRIYQRGARSRGLDFDLSREDMLVLIEAPCHYCGAEPSNVAKPHGKEIVYQGIDRKDNSLGYTKDNSVPCCWKCNAMKKAMHHDEFIDHIWKIAERYTAVSIGGDFVETIG